MNKVYFSKEQIVAEELAKFLNLLIEQSYGKGDNYNDIHIIPADLGAVILEWEAVPWSKEYGGHWQYINDDDDEVVAKWYSFPDNHSELLDSKETYQEALEDWLEEHKDEEWYKNEYDQWRSKKQQREWEEQIAKERENQNE